MSLDDLIDQAFRDGDLAEITIRVSRYAADGKTPAAFHAIAKHRSRIAGPWGVGVTSSGSTAARRALEPARMTDGGVFD